MRDTRLARRERLVRSRRWMVLRAMGALVLVPAVVFAAITLVPVVDALVALVFLGLFGVAILVSGAIDYRRITSEPKVCTAQLPVARLLKR